MEEDELRGGWYQYMDAQAARMMTSNEAPSMQITADEREFLRAIEEQARRDAQAQVSAERREAAERRDAERAQRRRDREIWQSMSMGSGRNLQPNNVESPESELTEFMRQHWQELERQNLERDQRRYGAHIGKTMHALPVPPLKSCTCGRSPIAQGGPSGTMPASWIIRCVHCGTFSPTKNSEVEAALFWNHMIEVIQASQDEYLNRGETRPKRRLKKKS